MQLIILVDLRHERICAEYRLSKQREIPGISNNSTN